MPRDHQPPRSYEIRIQGHLDQHWSDWFGGLIVTHEDDGTTTLRGAIADQAHLHGLLAKVRDLGATLISVNADEPAEPSTPEQEQNDDRHHRSTH
jgi:hypothetical protein